ncbi:hypothetical protein [Flavivirga rizhaonensis]|uniref:Uncharacterized protein n=1 Tax=Flavivirga rizhaonensis TaxID=2559571 RepID=A0A4S1DZY2_9FLAO|nr:hypothetical protein [Flavivirga rizhaonensis]TGV03595.1 hypothetical protein EM932_06100 [Flavivirga rizhaonensis]
MKKIEHHIFLYKNNLIIKSLLQPIQEKIAIFDRMYKLLETVSDCEKDELLEQLEALDLEIMEDLDEEYADTLSNNELVDEANEESPTTEKVEEVNIKIKSKKSKKLSDESILDELVQKGLTDTIGRTTLRDLGLQAPLGWDTVIGKYRVIRISTFKYRYRIELK